MKKNHKMLKRKKNLNIYYDNYPLDNDCDDNWIWNVKDKSFNIVRLYRSKPKLADANFFNIFYDTNKKSPNHSNVIKSNLYSLCYKLTMYWRQFFIIFYDTNKKSPNHFSEK